MYSESDYRKKKDGCWCNLKVIILQEEVTSTRTEEFKWKWWCYQNLGVQKRDDYIFDTQVFERSCQTAATWFPPAEVTPTFIHGRYETSIVLPLLAGGRQGTVDVVFILFLSMEILRNPRQGLYAWSS